jgi:hypothetical protein
LQFRLRTLLLVFVPVALVAWPLGNYLRQLGQPARLRVTGTVTRNGKPLKGASIEFLAKDRDDLAAEGVTDAMGAFELHTILAGQTLLKGVMPGDYILTIRDPDDANSWPEETSHGSTSQQRVTVLDADAQVFSFEIATD